MLQTKLNELLTQTGPGTAGGEWMRRYWQPVGISAQVLTADTPRQVRILSEDLVLFRDEHGRVGLLGVHCSHRCVSLAYGRIEDGGIRCPMHGWLYDVEGHCLETPAEPEESTLKDRVRHRAYPCRELGGMIFAYMGPSDAMPLLPSYETLVREDGTRKVDYYPINSNYLQNLEGAFDTPHGAYLHSDGWSKAKHVLAKLPRPRIEFAETDYGMKQSSHKASPSEDGPVVATIVTHFFMPAGFMRVQETHKNQGDVKKYQSWYVPADDTHMLRFQSSFAPLGTTDGVPYEWEYSDDFIAPGPENDYFRDYHHVDTISGIPTRTPGSSIKGFLVQDNMANETQGPIVDRMTETLGAHDSVLVAMRLVMLKAIEDVQAGRDPKHVIRDPEQNAIVYIRGEDALDLV